MIDLTTSYLGLLLKNPLVASSSPLTGNFDDVRRLEDAGASAIILPSLFEEHISHEQNQLDHYVHYQGIGHGEADSYHPVPAEFSGVLDNYLAYLQQLKASLEIPVIASLNGVSDNGWVDYGKELMQVGADALELNVYYVAADPLQTGEAVERRYLTLLNQLKQQVTIPITMKLSSQFSSVANMISKIESAGAEGVVLFNRFYQPNIDLDTLGIKPQLELSRPAESLLRIRWIALIRSRVELSLAATGGFHKAEDILKALLAGADAVYLCAVLLEEGPEYCRTLLNEIDHWLTEKEYKSIRQMQGSVSQACVIDPAVYEHSNYMDVIRRFKGKPK